MQLGGVACLERLAVEPGGVRVLDTAGGRGDRARDPDADSTIARRLLGGVYQRDDGRDRRAIVARGRGHAPPQAESAVVIEHCHFRLGPAEIDADFHACRLPHVFPHTAA